MNVRGHREALECCETSEIGCHALRHQEGATVAEW